MKLTCLGRYGPYPAPSGHTTSYLLQSEEATLLIDFGAGALSQLLDFVPMDQVDAILLSHLHADHISDMRILTYMLNPQVAAGKRGRLKVYLPCGPEKEYEEIANQPCFETKIIDEHTVLSFGNCEINFCHTIHPVPCYAMRFCMPGKTLAYSADSVYDEKLAAFAHGADVFVCDAAFTFENQPNNAPHMNGAEAGRLAKLCGAGALFLTHLNPTTDESALLMQARAEFPSTWTVKEHEAIEIRPL